MGEAEKVSLDKLRQALAQPNNAIRKRALAIIFNEARIEALDLLEEYLGRETEPDLQALALKVVRKLQEFKVSSSQVPTDKLLAFLQHPSLENRVLALRGLVDHRSPKLSELITTVCAREESPEALGLIAKILKKNPSPGNIPLLFRLLQSPVEEIRQEALEGILSIVFGCLYPQVLKCLLDPSAPLKMRAYQLISNISRTNLLEALEFMFANGTPDLSRLAGQLLPSFLGPDLLPLLDRNLSHRDPETVALCKRAIVLLAQKGNWEASALVEKMQAERAPAGPAAAKPAEEGPFQEFLEVFPRLLVEPLLTDFPRDDPRKSIYRLREVFGRLSEFLILPFITAYFRFAGRNPFLDRACFKVLRFGAAKANPVNLIRTLTPAFPPPEGKGDLFPLVLADRIQNDFNDHLLEQMGAAQKTLQGIDEIPGDAAILNTNAIRELVGLFRSLAPVQDNRLAMKYSDATGIKVADFMRATPHPIDPKLLQNFDLPLNIPLLVSRNSARAIPLGPFFQFDAARKNLAKAEPSENDLWEYLSSREILDNYFAYLKEKPSGNP